MQKKAFLDGRRAQDGWKSQLKAATSSDCKMFVVESRQVVGRITHFFTLSAGIANAQYTKEPNPPDRKLDKPVLI
jgi:hypothetical protein